jgi:uncharacterized protein YjbI with pentapeptide repeats
MRIENEKCAIAVSGSDLSQSSFRDVNLTSSVFHDVNLAGITIENADLAGARLFDCNLLGATIEGVLVSDLFAAYRTVTGKGADS